MTSVNDNNFNILINDSFRHIMYNHKYSQRGFRKYRVLFFCYTFGCIDSSVFFSLYPEDEIIDTKEQRISYANSLNYFYKQKYLKKEKNNYYTITRKGILSLYKYLTSMHSLEQDSFISHAKVIKLFCNHAIVYGITTLSYARAVHCSFQTEVPLSSLHIFPEVYEYNLLYPDVTIRNYTNNNILYIEADCSTEKRTSALIPKLTNYVNYFMNINSFSNTIHFSIWESSENYELLNSLSFSLNHLINLYSFCNDLCGINISLNLFLRKAFNLKKINNLFSFLTPVDFASLLGSNFFNENDTKFDNILNYFLVKNSLSNKFFSRQKYIFESYKSIPNFKHLLSNGLKIICAPFSSSNIFNNLLLYNNNFNTILFNYFMLKYSIIYEDFTHYFIYDFSDIYIDISYIFRNVFSTNISGKEHFFAFENISEDLGGYMRSRKYAANYSNYPLRDFTLICIYNNFTKNELLDFVTSRYPFCDFIRFISYEEILLSIEFS